MSTPCDTIFIRNAGRNGAFGTIKQGCHEAGWTTGKFCERAAFFAR